MNPEYRRRINAIFRNIAQVEANSHSLESPHQFKTEEITGIMKDFDEPGFLASTGLHLGGTKYMVI